MEFSELLAGEHKPIRRALNILESMRSKIQQGGDVDIHDVHAVLLFLRCFGDDCHQAKEELILFPALRQSLQNRNRPDPRFSVVDIEDLLQEHKQERGLIEKTQVALFAKEHGDFAKHAGKLIDLLREHIVEEERILFPLAEQILTKPEATALSMRIQEANATFGECQITLLMDTLKQLEQKFMSTAA